MLVNGVQINRDNLGDWSCTALRKMQKQLADNANQNKGEVDEERLLVKLITVEIVRQTKVDNINLSAEKKKESIIKRWDAVKRQSEPLQSIKRENSKLY